ncbi:glutamine-rich protein 2 isoform X1 [Corythoichthys intestinalis]|uniref:glutamine-rich protein 2 isoform X1 n=1 Tax=Corythoichthys intestinalis TaxID=161448 RepID=UPI0025A544B2|nr:glutamine-rich protein 2 isoform X1 [Corythoichthys intestinalis]XP_057673537.1 glutamine-rich protein 2 isoform X1 [Corythoichthys intestinalis]
MRRDDDATFGELVDESFGGARAGVLDLGSLRRLLLAILTRLGIRDEPAHGSEVVARIRACEDGLAQVLKLVEDIQSQTSALKLQSEELHIRQQGELRDAGVRLEARIDALETQKADGEQMDILRRLIRDTDQRETCRHLDERVRLHEEAIERLTKECRQLDDLQRVLDRMKLTLTSDPYKQSIQSIKNFGKKSSLPADSETAAADELSGSVSASILKLKRECDELQEAIGCLRDDNKHKHVHIQHLLRTSENLQENKIDKRSLHVEVKKQLEAQWKSFQRSRQRPHSPEDSWLDVQDGNAAAIRKQLLDTHHCLSCDRHIVTQLYAAKSVLRAWPSGSSTRPTSELQGFRYPSVSRSCGGGRAVSTPSRRLHSGWRPRSHMGAPAPPSPNNLDCQC